MNFKKDDKKKLDDVTSDLHKLKSEVWDFRKILREAFDYVVSSKSELRRKLVLDYLSARKEYLEAEKRVSLKEGSSDVIYEAVKRDELKEKMDNIKQVYAVFFDDDIMTAIADVLGSNEK